MRIPTILLLFILAIGICNHSYGIGEGQLKVHIRADDSLFDVSGTQVILRHGSLPPIQRSVDSSGYVYFPAVPSWNYILEVYHISYGMATFNVYVESQELREIECSWMWECHFGIPQNGDGPISGSLYGNTNLYRTDRILATP